MSKYILSLKTIFLSIAILCVAFLLSDIFWLFLSKDNTQLPVFKYNSQVINNTKLPLNIFGKENKVIKKAYKKVEATELNFFLVGIVNNSNQSFAIIKKVKNGFENIYKIGDKINSRAYIKDIDDKFVIISNNGKDEKLTIEYKVNKINKAFSQTTVKNNNKAGNKTNNKGVKLKYNVKRKLRSYLAGMKTNPASALAIVAVEPNFTAGLLNGFKVFPSKERELFFKIGFKSGDIIIKINDIELNQISQAFKIGKTLATQKVFVFVVLRDNVEHYINLDIN